tara:strand:+ start:222010 stop:222690 length:681 start_codon:yes stop_codon:yes gene_type:complete
MNKLTQIIALPTEEDSGIYKSKYGRAINIREDLFTNQNWQAIHLYITTDEFINEGDWYISITHTMDGRDIKPQIWKNAGNPCVEQPMGGKIIATTDRSLKIPNGKPYESQDLVKVIVRPEKSLPQPSTSFIKEYCDRNGLDEIMVVFNEVNHCCGAQGFGQGLDDRCPACKDDLPTPKLVNNEIIILLSKNTWNRKEIIDLFYDFALYKTSLNIDQVNDWVNENVI